MTYGRPDASWLGTFRDPRPVSLGAVPTLREHEARRAAALPAHLRAYYCTCGRPLYGRARSAGICWRCRGKAAAAPEGRRHWECPANPPRSDAGARTGGGQGSGTAGAVPARPDGSAAKLKETFNPRAGLNETCKKGTFHPSREVDLSARRSALLAALAVCGTLRPGHTPGWSPHVERVTAAALVRRGFARYRGDRLVLTDAGLAELARRSP